MARAEDGKAYHESCFLKVSGHRCDECYEPLIACSEHNLGGEWGLFEGRRLHLECYRTRGGPRCDRCFDVIAEDVAAGKSGNWVYGPTGAPRRAVAAPANAAMLSNALHRAGAAPGVLRGAGAQRGDTATSPGALHR